MNEDIKRILKILQNMEIRQHENTQRQEQILAQIKKQN